PDKKCSTATLLHTIQTLLRLWMATPLLPPTCRATPLHHSLLALIQLIGHSFRHFRPSKPNSSNNQFNNKYHWNRTTPVTKILMTTHICTRHPQPHFSHSTQHWLNHPQHLINHTSSTPSLPQPLKNAYTIFTSSKKSKTWSTLHLSSPTIMTYLRLSRSRTQSGPQLAPWLLTLLAQLMQLFTTFSSTRTQTTQKFNSPWSHFTKSDISYASFATTSLNCAVRHFTETRSSSLLQLLNDAPWWSHLHSWREPSSQTKSDVQPIKTAT
ncbi:hypothetical protein BGZ81_003781, partial [Podila clonocystis]